jgi:pimeloyl-ACP methyl ester carboxylesterase
VIRDRPEYRRTDLATHLVPARAVSVGGVTISFRDSGDAAWPAIVLLHGGSSSAATWDRLTEALTAAGHRVIAADLRGHGGSSHSGNYPLHAYGDDIRRLMDALEIESAAFVGHSLGGYAASTVAQQDPARITRLVLEEPGMPARDPGGRDGLSGSRFLLPALAVLATRRGFDRKAVTSAVRQLRVPDPAWWAGLAQITAPTLLISGGPASHIPPGQLAEAARQIRGSQLVTIPAGHRVHSRSPERFLAEVLPFLTAEDGNARMNQD